MCGLSILFFLSVEGLFASIGWAQTTSTALATAAEQLENPNIRYVPDYIRIAYPFGDVPSNTGVCTDVIVRAYRGVGIDLQHLLHEDILAHPERYPNIRRPDSNIDHRRVPNLATFFRHHGESIPVTQDPRDYLPGDILWWKLGSPTGLNHIGIVVGKSAASGVPLVIHNMGGGQVIEDILFHHPIVGHYRYIGE